MDGCFPCDDMRRVFNLCCLRFYTFHVQMCRRVLRKKISIRAETLEIYDLKGNVKGLNFLGIIKVGRSHMRRWRGQGERNTVPPFLCFTFNHLCIERKELLASAISRRSSLYNGCEDKNRIKTTSVRRSSDKQKLGMAV